MSRYIAVKEEHAEKVKQDVRVIWGDYFKPQHIEQYPELHALTHEIMSLGSKCRQTVDRETALKLVDKLNRFAEIFWATKGVAVKRAKALMLLRWSWFTRTCKRQLPVSLIPSPTRGQGKIPQPSAPMQRSCGKNLFRNFSLYD